MSKIPEGTTHTAPDGTYRMERGSLWYGYADGDWVFIEGAAPHCYTKIQAEPKWSGEGLPPAGTACEVCTQDEWVEVTIRYVGEHRIIAHDGENERCWLINACMFRTVRTPDQISAEKRDAAIKEMQRLVGSCNTFPFAELYDYGYRLQVAE